MAARMATVLRRELIENRSNVRSLCAVLNSTLNLDNTGAIPMITRMIGSFVHGRSFSQQRYQTLTSTTNGDQSSETSKDHPLSDIDDPFKEPIKPCILCKTKVPISYKNVQLLSQFVSPNTGRIYGRHITKLCHYQQRRLAVAIKRSRKMGFMPVMYRETVFLKDPSLFGIEYTGSVTIAMQEPSNITEPEISDLKEDETDSKK